MSEKWQLERLLPRHYGVLRLVVAGTHSRTQIAEMMGYTPQAVGQIIDSPFFQTELARRRQSLQREENHVIANSMTMTKELLEKVSIRAVETLEGGLMGLSNKDQISAADKILKYAMPRDAETRGSVTNTVVVLSDDKIERLRAVLSEAGITRSEIVDAELVSQ